MEIGQPWLWGQIVVKTRSGTQASMNVFCLNNTGDNPKSSSFGLVLDQVLNVLFPNGSWRLCSL